MTEPNSVDITPQASPATPAPAPEGAPSERMLPQSQVNAIVAREKAALAAQRDEMAQRAKAAEERLAALDAARAAEEESKLSVTQRMENERKREREALEKAANEARSMVASERNLRRQKDVRYEASRRVASIAPRLFSPELTDDVTELVSRALEVEEVDGRERLAIRINGELETYTDEAWQRFADARLSRYFRGEPGSGGPHGNGNGRGPARTDWQKMTPAEKIALGIAGSK